MTYGAPKRETAVLLVTCPDRKGVVASIAEFIYRHNGNILHADEHGDGETNLFLMRVEWDLAGFDMDGRPFISPQDWRTGLRNPADYQQSSECAGTRGFL